MCKHCFLLKIVILKPIYSYTNEPNCTVACIERNDDIYCNPRCDLPQELQEYPVHLKPDVYVKYESAYLNICVYIVGTVSVFLMLAYGIFKTYQNCQLAKTVIKKSMDTMVMISNYSIKNISKTLKRKTMERLHNKDKDNVKKQEKLTTEVNV